LVILEMESHFMPRPAWTKILFYSIAGMINMYQCTQLLLRCSLANFIIILLLFFFSHAGLEPLSS
jgi:hypothetical protein